MFSATFVSVSASVLSLSILEATWISISPVLFHSVISRCILITSATAQLIRKCINSVKCIVRYGERRWEKKRVCVDGRKSDAWHIHQIKKRNRKTKQNFVIDNKNIRGWKFFKIKLAHQFFVVFFVPTRTHVPMFLHTWIHTDTWVQTLMIFSAVEKGKPGEREFREEKSDELQTLQFHRDWNSRALLVSSRRLIPQNWLPNLPSPFGYIGKGNMRAIYGGESTASYFYSHN